VCRPDDVGSSSKSAANESHAVKASQPSNSVHQKHRQSAASQRSVDSGTSASVPHEEWETASESSDVLKDSELQSTRHGSHTGSRQESRRGYSNQRHTQSRRGRYRDHTSGDGVGKAAGGTTRQAPDSENTSRADAGLSRTNTASVTATNTAGGGVSHGTSPSAGPFGPNGGIHPIFRADQAVSDAAAVVPTAVSDAR